MHDANDRRQGRRAWGTWTGELCPFETFEFRAESNSYEVRYDEELVPASIAVIGAMARVLGRSPERLSALRETVDLEALDTLCGPDSDRAPVDRAVTFRYYNREVVVRNSGRLTIREPAAEGFGVGCDGRVRSTSG